MSHHFAASIFLFPVLAMVLGVAVYFGMTKVAKIAELGRCLFFCGLFCAIWILTFGGR